MKVAVVTCHNQPDYIRAVTLRRALSAQPGVQAIIIKNHFRGILRYPEMALRLIWLRLRHRPDKYLLTFRGYEILPFMAVATWPKPLIYDELINPIEWLQEARLERWARLIPKSLLARFNRLLLQRCETVITDTHAHSLYAAKLMNLPKNKFVSLPVSTDEDLFYPHDQKKQSDYFEVFYYGSMLPLHGLDVVLAAAAQLTDLPLRFTIIGGKSAMAEKVIEAQARGIPLQYKRFIPFKEIPDIIAASDVCLAGPFGNTTQARKVITGKAYQFLASGAVTVIGKNEASEHFIDKKNSMVVPLGDAHALAESLRWAYNNQKRLPDIAEAGRKTYEKYYSNEVIAQQMAQILNRSSS